MVSQNKMFSFKIKRQAKNVFPRDVERTVANNADPDQRPQSRLIRVYSVCLHLNTGMSIKVTRHAAIGNRLVQSVEVEESTPRKRVKGTTITVLTLKTPRKPASKNVVCLLRLLNILADLSNLFLHTGKQCGPRSGAVWSGSILFAKITFKITSRWQGRRQLLWLAV